MGIEYIKTLFPFPPNLGAWGQNYPHPSLTLLNSKKGTIRFPQTWGQGGSRQRVSLEIKQNQRKVFSSIALFFVVLVPKDCKIENHIYREVSIVNCYKYLWLGLLISGYVCDRVEAQVTTDGTTNTSLETTDSEVTINDGDRAGNNLFHSFEQFSVPDEGSASFNNPTDIENIFSRVTGGDVSNVNGTINANGGANLLLINPSGIVFGENATLNIGGSFMATSADSLVFESGEFSAVNPDAAPILTINRPIGLNFSNNPGNIVNRSNFGLQTTSVDIGLIPEFTVLDSVGLQVNDGETISFIGGNVVLENASGITASGGTVELGGLSEAGVIAVSNNSLVFPEGVERGDVILTGQSRVNVTGDNGGFININAKNLELSQQSELYAGIAENSGSDSVAEDINIDATDSVRIIGELDNSSGDSFEELLEAQAFVRDYGTGIRNTVGLPSTRRNPDRSTSIGNGGDINIDTTTLELRNVAIIDTSIFGTGNGGDINISAGNITLSGDLSTLISRVRGTISDRIVDSAIGDGGNININTDTISFEKQTGILSEVQPEAMGNGGDININATEEVALINENGFSFFLTQLNTGAVGNGGNININAGSFSSNPNSLLLSDTQSMGNAGNITITTESNITLDSSQIQSQTIGDAVGNAGNITLSAGDSLLVTEGTLILADTQAVGDGGNISVSASNRLVFSGISEAGFPSQFVAGLSRPSSQGRGGTIEINAGELSLSDATFITSNSVPNSVGEAGDIIIDVDRLNLQDNSLINTFTGNSDDGGSITVNAQNINLTSGGKILAATEGGGDGGNINLNVTEEIAIDNSVQSSTFIETPESLFLEEFQTTAPSGIYANATPDSTGDSGNVIVGMVEGQILQNFILTNQGQIVVNSDGTGSGGNIFIGSQDLQLENNAAISASTVFGTGGEVILQIADNLLLRNNSLISARAFQAADGGNLSIDTDLIFASPNQNNDIIANAERGSGGNIELTAESIIGIQERSSNPPNSTNDLDVSSDLSIDGTVTINNPDVDPTAGIVELPAVPIDAEAILAQDLCQVENEDIAGGSSFIVTGRGGLTPTSAESLSNLNRVVGWTDESAIEVSNGGAIAVTSEGRVSQVQQAQGLMVANGSLWLTANPTNAVPQSATKHPDCNS